jgi:hypothetical protein
MHTPNTVELASLVAVLMVGVLPLIQSIPKVLCMYRSSKHAEMNQWQQYNFASRLLKENVCFWHFTKNISPRRCVIVVATCFLGRINLILASTAMAKLLFCLPRSKSYWSEGMSLFLGTANIDFTGRTNPFDITSRAASLASSPARCELNQ